MENENISLAETLDEQYSTLYRYGAYSDNSRFVNKRFRFFAPLFVHQTNALPDAFCIFRIDRTNANTITNTDTLHCDLHETTFSGQKNRGHFHNPSMKISNFAKSIYTHFAFLLDFHYASRSLTIYTMRISRHRH